MKRIFSIILIGALLYSSVPFTAYANESRVIQDEVIYDVLVDRFNNGDQKNEQEINVKDPYAYHGGDLIGITRKLDDIKSLGFTTISISPIMENAERGYHGYWTTDFKKVEPHFGTMQDFKNLVKEAHKKDMKIIMEFSPGYVADTSEIATDSDKSDWILKDKPKKTLYWKENIKKLNLENKDVEQYMEEVGLFWMNKTDVDGFRIQGADQVPESFLHSFTKTMKELNEDFYIIAGMETNAESYERISAIQTIDAVENIRFKETADDVYSELAKPITDLTEETKGILKVDDNMQKRFAQIVGEEGRNAATVWKLALTYMYTSPGVPMIYQGSELPMYAPGLPESQDLVKFNSGDPELKEFYERIGSLRQEFPVLRHGDFQELDSSGAMTVFKRSDKKDAMYVAINNDKQSRAVKVSDVPEGKRLKGLLGDNMVKEDKNGEFTITIPRESSEIYFLQDDTGINWLFIGFIIAVMLVFIFGVIYLGRKDKKRVQKG